MNCLENILLIITVQVLCTGNYAETKGAVNELRVNLIKDVLT